MCPRNRIKPIPGFVALRRFRNDLAHGIVNKCANSLEETKALRRQAKDIVAELFVILQQRGYEIPRDTNSYDALAGQDTEQPTAPAAAGQHCGLMPAKG